MLHLNPSFNGKACAIPINKSVPIVVRAALLLSMVLIWSTTVYATSGPFVGGTVVINEVDADTPGTDALEFVELFGTPNQSLDGMVLVFFNGSDDQSYLPVVDLDGHSLDANGFFVAGSAGVANVDLVIGTTNIIQNGADAVALYFGDGTDFPNDSPISTVNLIDAVVYDTNDGDDAALLVLLNGGQPQLNEDDGTDSSTDSNSRVPDGGTPRNTDTYVAQPPTPGATNAPVVSCGIMFDPESAICFMMTPGPGNDTYDLSIPYTGTEAGITIVNNSGSGVVGGDDPTTTTPGTITVTGISEDDNYSVTFTSPCDGITVSGAAPDCEPVVLSDVFITELADPDNDAGARFVELHNRGASTVDLSGWALRRWTNGDATPQGDDPLTGCIPAGGFYLISNNSGTFAATYGFAADQDLGGGGPADSNGDDQIGLVDNTNTLVDFFGVVGEDGNGTCHEFEDGRVERAASVTGGTATWDEADWNVWSDSNNGGCTNHTQDPQDAPADFDPGSWIGAVSTGCGISVHDCEASTSCNSFTAGLGDTYDLSIPYKGIEAGTTVINSSGSGAIGGDDPAAVTNGTIVITGISEADAYNVTFSAPCGSTVVAGAAPLCEPPPVIFNEVDYDSDGVDDAEYIELYNVSVFPYDLSGCTIDLVNQSGSIYNTIILDPVILAAGDYYVICGDGGNVPNCDQVLIGQTTDIIQNGHFTDGISPDGMQLIDAGSNVLDQLSYEGDNPVTTETAGIIPYDTLPGASMQRFPDGTDSNDNSADFGLRCLTPGTANLDVVSTSLIIDLETVFCESVTEFSTDLYTVIIPYQGMDVNAVVTNNSGSGTANVGDDPASFSDGLMIFENISELDNFSITIDVNCAPIVISGPHPNCDPPLPLFDLVINEVDYDQSGTDLAEFIEIYNNEAVSVNLENYAVELINGSNDTEYLTILLPDVDLAAGDYFVICQDPTGGGSTVANCDLEIADNNGFVQNGHDAIGLRNPDGVLLDAVSYEGDVAGYTEATGTSAADNSALGLGLSRVPNGGDTDDNDADFALACITPGEENVCDALFCNGVGACADVSVQIATDGSGTEISWEIIPQGGCQPLCSASGLADNALVSSNCCLPDGCFQLRVYDEGGDGIAGGGYILRDINGERIIDNEGNFGSGGLSAMSNTALDDRYFCLPLGTDKMIASQCDKENFNETDFLIASGNPAVLAEFGGPNASTSGYQWKIFNPNGGYIRHLARTHTNLAAGVAPGPSAVQSIRPSNWWTLPVPGDELMNVRIRTRVAGVWSAYGPACRHMWVSAQPLCPITRLVDDVNNSNYSCGNDPYYYGGSDRLVAYSVPGAGAYRFTFKVVGEPTTFVRYSLTNVRQLLWSNNTMPLNAPYEVSVAVRMGGPGDPWCDDGPACLVSILSPSMAPPQTREATANTGLALWPNPNSGSVLNLRLDEISADVDEVVVEIYDAFGKRVHGEAFADPGNSINTVLDLNGNLANGIYMVNVIVGDEVMTQRLVVQ